MSLSMDEGETEQNEIRNLHTQLGATNELVNILSKQLRDLREQVCNILFIGFCVCVRWNYLGDFRHNCPLATPVAIPLIFFKFIFI